MAYVNCWIRKYQFYKGVESQARVTRPHKKTTMPRRLGEGPSHLCVEFRKNSQ